MELIVIQYFESEMDLTLTSLHHRKEALKGYSYNAKLQPLAEMQGEEREKRPGEVPHCPFLHVEAERLAR